MTIMDIITIVTAALIISLILLAFKLNSLYRDKKAGKINKIFEFKRSKPKPETLEKNYRNIVKAIEEGLLKMKKPETSLEEFRERLEKFKHFDYRNLNEDEIFWTLTSIIFFNMGRKASMIEKKLPLLKEYLYGYERLAGLTDTELNRIIVNTGFDKQVRWCKDNAGVFKGLIDKFGSFGDYLSKEVGINDINCSEAQLIKLHKDLTMLFEGVGETSGWHFITEMGFFALKPDKVIRRIFNRLGLIQSQEDLADTIEIGRQMSDELKLPIRYIDIIFAKFGQVGESDLLGTTDGICTENDPKCNTCTLTAFCDYFSKSTIGRQI